MILENSLPGSQGTASCPYSEPGQSSLRSPTYLLKTPFNIIILSTSRSTTSPSLLVLTAKVLYESLFSLLKGLVQTLCRPQVAQ